MTSIFTDSAANLTYEMKQEYGIKAVSLHCYIDNNEVDQRKDFDGKSFYDSMRNGSEARTSMVNITEFSDAFEQELIKGNDLIFISLSSGVSGTYNSAKLAAEELREKYPEQKICIIDSRAAGLGEGMLAMLAAQMVRDGADFDETAQEVQKKTDNMCQFFTVENLDYLQKGGRVSKVTAKMGNLLDIKPILKGSEEGEIIACQKVRGMKKAYEAIADKYDDLVFDKEADIAISHADNSAGVNILTVMLRERGFKGKVRKAYFEPVTGSHVGPGAVALFFFGKHK